EVLELLGAKAELLPVAVEAGPGQVEGEGVVAGGDRRVDGEHGVRGHELARLGERASLRDELAAALERHERAVALVHVPARRPDPDGAQQAHAADPEHDLLADAGALVAAVEPGEETAVL